MVARRVLKSEIIWGSGIMAGIDNFFDKPYKGGMRRTLGQLYSRLAAMALAALAVAAPFGIASAQDAAPESKTTELAVELNSLQPTSSGCRFTFMVKNDLGGELTSAAFELVLFDKAGMVSRMTIVDFKDLPNGKTKVRQFDFSGVDCAKLGRVLINDATECKGEGIDPRACIRSLSTESRTEATLGT